MTPFYSNFFFKIKTKFNPRNTSSDFQNSWLVILRLKGPFQPDFDRIFIFWGGILSHCELKDGYGSACWGGGGDNNQLMIIFNGMGGFHRCQLYEQENVAKLKSTFFPFYRNMIIKSESTSPWVGCSQDVHLSLSQLLQDIRPAIFTTLLHMWDASELKLIRGTTYVLDILCFSFHIPHTCILPSRMRTLYWPSTWMWLRMVGLPNQARGVNSFLTQSQLGQTLVHLLPNKDKQHRREMDGWIDGWMDGWLLPGSTSGTNPSNAPLPPPASHNSV